jgi:hypothetical protein
MAQPTYAAVIEGIEFAEKLSPFHGKTLELNGTGLRTATFFQVRVYAAGLYLTQKSPDSATILKSSEPKVLRMVFLRDVDGKDIAKAWDDSFPKNCKKDCETFQPLIAKLKASTPSVKKGDSMVYRFTQDEVELLLNDKPIVSLKSPGFPNTLLSTWIGEHPPTEALRDGLLKGNPQ